MPGNVHIVTKSSTTTTLYQVKNKTIYTFYTGTWSKNKLILEHIENFSNFHINMRNNENCFIYAGIWA